MGNMGHHSHPSCYHPYEKYEINGILRRHEDLISRNRTSIFIVTSQVHGQEETHNIEHVVIMETLLQQKRQIQALET